MREKELRLALVCYGGVSLAVYMHGVTKEVWHLVRASRAYQDGEPAVSDIERVYADLLATVEAQGDAKLRVIADIVAGASAGGINGIFLAQAIASGQSLDPLTALWLDSADVDSLVDPGPKGPSKFSRLWATPLAWALAGRQDSTWDDDLDPATRAEVYAKLTRLVRARWFEPPFGGETFDRLLLDAFDAMAAGPTGPRLLPAEQPLDLFVTVTDFNGHAERLELNSPPEIVETEHRLTLGFRDSPAERTLDQSLGLVFAARATASFPGAFPPFNVAELDKVLAEQGREWPERDSFLTRMIPKQKSPQLAEKTVLIDGSVLANAPFRPAIEALRDRPARREVDRRFVYIDPKPGMRSVRLTRGGDMALPGFFTTLFGALSDIPREQPIRDNLDAISARSERVRRTRRVVEALRVGVEASVEALFGRTLFLDRPTPQRLAAWRARAFERASTDAGHAFIAYREIATGGIADALARATGLPSAAILAALTARTDNAGLDLRYRIRRLRSVARRLGELSEASGDAAYEKLLVAVYDSLAPYLELERPAAAPPDSGLSAVAAVQAMESSWQLAALDAATDTALAQAIAACPRPLRRAPLLAYLGFPFYDIATLSLLQGEGFDEFDPVKVDRISPEDAVTLRSGGAPATLKGIQFNSFGAFFSRTYRENDYLWGRLHGAERLIDIVASTLPNGLAAAELADAKRAAFLAILDDEAGRLTNVAELVETLRAQVVAMTRHDTPAGLD